MLSRSASLMVEHKCSQLFWQVATAVEYLHALGIAHRRINVDCVLLDPDVNLKLMDFGCAINFLGKGHQLEKNHPIALKYLPPEAFNAEVKDQRHIDIWQLGLLLFKLLTKLDPFDRLEGTALTDKLAAGTVFMPKFISEEGRAFLGLMLNPNPDLRPTAEQVLQHPWMKRNCPSTYPLVQQSVDIDRQALKKMSTGFKVDRRFHSRMIESLISNEKNWLTAKEHRVRRSKFTFIQDKDEELLQSTKKKNTPNSIVKNPPHKYGGKKSPSPDTSEYPKMEPVKLNKPLSKSKTRLLLPKDRMQSSDDQLESSASRIKSISSWKKTDPKLPNLFGKDRKGLKEVAKTRETSVHSSVKWNSAKLKDLPTPHDPFLRKSRKKPQPEEKPFFVIRDCSPRPADVQKALSELGSQRSREKMLSAEKHMRSRLRQSQMDELSKDINMTDKQFKHRDEEDKYLRAKELYLKKKSNPFKLNADQDLGASRSSNASGIHSEIAASRSSTGPRYGSDFVVSASNNQSQVIGNNNGSNKLDALGWFRYNIFDGSKKSAQNESYLQHLQKSSSVKSQLKISTPVKSILLVTKKADKSLRIDALSQSPK